MRGRKLFLACVASFLLGALFGIGERIVEQHADAPPWHFGRPDQTHYLRDRSLETLAIERRRMSCDEP